MFRSIILPTLVVCIIAAPFLLSNDTDQGNSNGDADPAGIYAGQAAYGTNGGSGVFLPSAQYGGGNAQPRSPFLQTSSPLNSQNAPSGHPYHRADGALGIPVANPANPDFGVDLSMPPMEFVPAANLEEIFNFDISANWIKNRWKRVSTSPGGDGLHGLRVALVTGTNAWDLHGSLTYYFDQNQKCQRITFLGWTGDGSRMEAMLTQKYGFRSQATHLAGLLLRKSVWETTGALILQYPAVIRTDNPVQQVAILFEMNNPKSRFVISEEVGLQIKGAQEGF